MQYGIRGLLIILYGLGVTLAQSPTGKTPPANSIAAPLSADQKLAIRRQYERVLEKFPIASEQALLSVDVHSRRADALFFLGRFDEAVTEYKAMVKLNPRLDESHWRLGIALFFADKSEQAVAQFEKYHSFDDVDRENGIWRYLSQFKATNAETAARELIRYEKDDREPFPAVYKLFDGSLSPEGALKTISESLPETERDKRLFYTELYIGMHCVVKNQPKLARKYLARSVARKWPRDAGFGPEYMWHVGRVQLELLEAAKVKP